MCTLPESLRYKTHYTSTPAFLKTLFFYRLVRLPVFGYIARGASKSDSEAPLSKETEFFYTTAVCYAGYRRYLGVEFWPNPARPAFCIMRRRYQIMVVEKHKMRFSSFRRLACLNNGKTKEDREREQRDHDDDFELAITGADGEENVLNPPFEELFI